MRERAPWEWLATIHVFWIFTSQNCYFYQYTSVGIAYFQNFIFPFPIYYIWHGIINDLQATEKTPTYKINECERAEWASLDIFRIFTFSKTAIPFNIIHIFCRYDRTCLAVYTCTDKMPNLPTKLREGIMGGGGGEQLPLAPLASTL